MAQKLLASMAPAGSNRHTTLRAFAAPDRAGAQRESDAAATLPCSAGAAPRTRATVRTGAARSCSGETQTTIGGRTAAALGAGASATGGMIRRHRQRQRATTTRRAVVPLSSDELRDDAAPKSASLIAHTSSNAIHDVSLSGAPLVVVNLGVIVVTHRDPESVVVIAVDDDGAPVAVVVVVVAVSVVVVVVVVASTNVVVALDSSADVTDVDGVESTAVVVVVGCAPANASIIKESVASIVCAKNLRRDDRRRDVCCARVGRVRRGR